MNWTSAKVPLWQLDCQNFWRAGTAFEVRDVSSPEDQRFIDVFTQSHNLTYTRKGDTAIVDTPDFAQRSLPTGRNAGEDSMAGPSLEPHSLDRNRFGSGN